MDMEINGLSRERIAMAATCAALPVLSSRPPELPGLRTVCSRITGEARSRSATCAVRFVGALYSGRAYGALLEGERLCLPVEPQCESRPLRTVRATGKKRTVEAHPALFSSHD